VRTPLQPKVNPNRRSPARKPQQNAVEQIMGIFGGKKKQQQKPPPK